MSHYLRVVPGFGAQTWFICDQSAFRLGVPNPERNAGCYFRAGPGESIWEAIRRQAISWFGPNGESPFQEIDLGYRQFHPRIGRPYDHHPDDGINFTPSAENEPNVVAVASGQLIALTRQLGRICQTVHPAEETFGTFGHDIRNLLILACTEVEAHWRGVLVANGADKSCRFSTRQYVMLKEPMRLDEYAVSFPCYPWLTAVSPFHGWGSTGNPTKELAWYAAYNAVKHDRENEFHLATLQNAFAALSACFVMIVAQFGKPAAIWTNPELKSFFQLTATPRWPLSLVYIATADADPANRAWSPVNYSFL